MNEVEEQRVIEALQAFTGGLTVTEHDIIDASARMQRNLKKPPPSRRPLLVAVAAVVLLVAGIVSFQSLTGDQDSAPPVIDTPTPGEALSDALDEDAYFKLPGESGTAPTIEQLNGLWTMRPYGDTSIPLIVTGDGSYRLGIAQPGNGFSTSTISGHTWIRATPSPSGCPQEQRYAAALLPDGSLRLQIDQADTSCTVTSGAEVWDPLAPGTPMADYLLAMARAASWQPVAETSLQEGLYVAPDTGHVLEVGVDGSYRYYDSLTEDKLVPADRGDLEPGAGTVTGSCTGGDFSGNLETAQIPGAEGLMIGTTAMRITAESGGCESGVTADEVWVRVVDQVG